MPEGVFEMARVAAAWALFAVFHSLTVSEGYERLARSFLGERFFAAWHRLLFTAYTGAAFLGLVLYLRTVPDAPLFRLDGWPRLACRALQAGGLAFLLWTPWDVKEFIGLRSWERARNRAPAGAGTADRLFTEKAYSVVRHPLYLGISAILVFRPAQSRTTLVSTIMAVLYFCAGTFLEEARLVRKFGDDYRRYQAAVPRILPRLRRPERRAALRDGTAPP